MDYLLFDLIAVALPAALLLQGGRLGRSLVVPVAVLSTLALVWTAPWDGYLVRTGVWGYDPVQVLGQLGSVPVEEFAFVVLEVLLVGAWALRTGALPARPVAQPMALRSSRWRGAAGWSSVAVLGIVLLLLGGHVRYLGLLLAWAAPPLALQRAVGGDVLADHRGARLRTVLPVALWLCAADRIALALGVWAIAPATSTGWSVLGLPLEEGLFFLLTCLLVADGLLLASDPAVRRRVTAPWRGRSTAHGAPRPRVVAGAPAESAS